jgi:outer membrane protein OmpA-like peptidoglycan-associated protein
LISSTEKYSYQWETAGQTQPAYALVQVNPVLKLVFEDGSLMEPQAEFEFTVRPETTSWTLRILDKASGRELRTLQATLPLLKNWTWDGLNQTGALVLNPAEGWVYQLEVVYPQGQEVVVSAAIHGIKARRVRAQAGQEGLLIPEILFDFNSAVLKPEMLDKITAAAQVLRRHSGKAIAICEGHADEIGSQELNRKISVQRAYMVAKFMSETLQIPMNALFVRGFGKNQPEVVGYGEDARARNRRVEIRILVDRP